jgi:hypothetical protein
MSEYQYYEFAAVERPLSPKQQSELRRHSSRAVITPGGFVNEYHWGDLKGDPLAWMRRYFDAHVYSSNWGSCRLMLRLPLESLDRTALDDHLLPSQTGAGSGFSDAFAATADARHWILDWSFNDDSGEHDRFWMGTDGPGWMARLLPLREELLRGDTRPLYLGWLARVDAGELGGDDPEPPLPAGLATLTPAQQALAEFLMVDPDRLAAAAETSPAAQEAEAVTLDAWLDSQSPGAMRSALRLLVQGKSHEAERAVRRDFLDWQRAQQPTVAAPERRSVARIEQRVETARRTRLERERRAREAEDARRRAERARHLASVADEADRHWRMIDTTLQRGSGAAYDEALERLGELSEALGAAGREADFRRRLAALMRKHGKRPAWRARLEKSGFL